MNDLEARIREVLHEDANRAPFVGAMPEQVRPRVRRRQKSARAAVRKKTTLREFEPARHEIPGVMKRRRPAR